MSFEAWMLGAIDEAGYNGIRDEHLDKVAQRLLATDLTEIDRPTFERACRASGVAPGNFSQEDLDRLQARLNELS